MRLGLSWGLVPYQPQQMNARVAAAIHELGFTGIHAHFGLEMDLEPHEMDLGACREARDVLADFGIRIVQSWGWGANLVDPDPAARSQGLTRLIGSLRVAQELGATGVVVGGGSLSARGVYWPHPRNHDGDVRETLERSLIDVAGAAEDHGVQIVLEGHVTTPLRSPEIFRDTLDRVGSSYIRANIDPVNYVTCIDDAYNSTAVIDRTIDCLADVAVSGHVKDLYLEDRLVVHISETVIGQGVFAISHYLERFETAMPDAFMFIEHLPEDLVSQAATALHTLLDAADIKIRTDS
jgi:sugar phosphate isomerase/epimerase